MRKALEKMTFQAPGVIAEPKIKPQPKKSLEKTTRFVEYFKNDDQEVWGHSTATIFYSQCGEDLDVYVDFISKRIDIFENTGTYIEVGGSDGVKLGIETPLLTKTILRQ